MVHQTPLQAAGPRRALRELLLAHGAEDTPFSLVACGEVERVAEVLRDDPAWTRTTDEVDKTLLFYAAARHDLVSMEHLLEHGAEPQHTNRTGKPVIESTRDAGIRRLLSEHSGPAS